MTNASPRKPRIAAAIIAQNEQRNLAELLPRLSWCDQMVVVDGGSRDATVDVALANGAKVVVHAFDNFARQRNRALAAIDADWVLSIDADERPSEAFLRALPEAVASKHAAFRVPIRSRIFGRSFRFSGTQDDRPIRLFRHAGARWQGDVHELLHVGGSVARLRQGLDHVTLPDLPAFLAKMARYTTLEAEARMRRGRPPRTRDFWLAPPREVFRRLVWKHGWLDGPQGWMFCVLSGVSEWQLARRHRRMWDALGGSHNLLSSAERHIA